MSETKKTCVKPKITIIPCDSPKNKAIFQSLEHESRGLQFIIAHPPPLSSNENR